MKRTVFASLFLLAFVSAGGTTAWAKVMPMPKQTDTANNRIYSHKTYDLEACKNQSPSEDAKPEAPELCNNSCNKTSAPALVSQLKNLQPAMQATFSVVQDDMLDGFRKHLLDKIETNRKLNAAIVKCFRGEKPDPGVIKNDDCAGAVQRSKELAAKELPKLRQHMAMMAPDRVPENTEPNQAPRGTKLTTDIKHPYFGFKPEPLTAAEVQSAEKEFDKETQALKQDFLEDQAKGLKCLVKKGDVYVIPDQQCDSMLGGKAAIKNGVYSRRNSQRKKHEAAYADTLAGSPFLAYYKGSSVNISTANQQLADAYAELEKKMAAEVARLRSLPKSDFKDLVAYKSELNSYLKTLPQVPKPYCDVAQTMIDQRTLNEYAVKIGIGAIAMVGTGLCTVTLGASCVGSTMVAASVTSSLAAEAVTLARAKSMFQKAADQYVAGSTSLDELREAEEKYNTELVMAPSALVGTGLVSGIWKQSTLTLRAEEAARNQLAQAWTKSLSATQTREFQKKLAADAAMKADYERVAAKMTDLVKSKNAVVSPLVQDSFMTNIQRAVADLKDGDILNMSFYQRSLEKVMKANPNTAEAKLAAKEFKAQTEILRLVNGEAGNSLRAKLDAFLAKASLKLKRISASEARAYKDCLIGTRGMSKFEIKSNKALACWESPSDHSSANL